jgi:hypothetical protein
VHHRNRVRQISANSHAGYFKFGVVSLKPSGEGRGSSAAGALARPFPGECINFGDEPLGLVGVGIDGCSGFATPHDVQCRMSLYVAKIINIKTTAKPIRKPTSCVRWVRGRPRTASTA